MREITKGQWFVIVVMLYPVAVFLHLRDWLRHGRRQKEEAR